MTKFANSIIFCLATIFSYSQIQPHGKGIAYKFIENKNQWPSQVKFATDIPGGRLFVSNDHLTYLFYDQDQLINKFGRQKHPNVFDKSSKKSIDDSDSIRLHSLKVSFLDANYLASIIGEEEQVTRYNYFLGNDSSKWGRGAKSYNSVVFKDLYKDVDLKLYSDAGYLKYDLYLKPGAEMDKLRIKYHGAENVYLKNGNLIIETSLNEIIEQKPFAYQFKSNNKYQISCKFEVNKDIVTFNFPEGFDNSNLLVIDPLLIFSSYSGSTADNWGNTATFDDQGNLYSGGMVRFDLGSFPTTTGAYQENFNGLWDIGIIKYDSVGVNFLYVTYLGGTNTETPQSLVVNNKGELLILGATSSLDFPVNGYQNSFGGGFSFSPLPAVPYQNGSDIFIAKLSNDGSELLASTFLGGSGNDGINFIAGDAFTNNKIESPLARNYGDQFRGDITIGPDDHVYIASNTSSSDFPVVDGVQSSYNGGLLDAIVVKLTPNLSSIEWSTYIGGDGTDAAYSIKLDSLDNVFLAGGTNSSNFPGIDGISQTYSGNIDGWVLVINSDGSQFNHGTYLGTSSYDQVYFLDLDSQENVYVLGQTQGDYPVSAGVYSNPNSGQFIHKLSKNLSQSLFSTVFGSGTPSPNISPTAFLVNDCQNLYVAGWGGSVNAPVVQFPSGIVSRNYVGGNTFNLPVTDDAFQSNTFGSDFYLMVLSDDASELLYATYLGGNASATHVDGGTSRFDKRGIVYHAVCAGCGGLSDFPTTSGAPSQTNNSFNCNNAAFKFDLASLRARLQTNNIELTQPGYSSGCEPIEVVFQNQSIGGEEFEWDFGDGNVITTTDTSDIIHLYEQAGSYNVVLKAFDKNTCISEDFTTTTILVSGIDPVVGSGGDICEGDSFKLFATGGAIYQWSPTESLDDPTSPGPLATPDDTTVYKVLMDNGFGCQFEDSVTVNVIPIISSDFILEKDLSCNQSPVFNFTTQYEESDAAFNWDFGDGQISTDINVSHIFEIDGSYTVKLNTQNEFCISEKTMVVQSVRLNVPNVITPNSDIYNQFLEIEAVEKVELSIFNRWGRVVFSTKDYQNDWDGIGLSTGVYYYDFKVVNKVECSGWIQLLR